MKTQDIRTNVSDMFIRLGRLLANGVSFMRAMETISAEFKETSDMSAIITTMSKSIEDGASFTSALTQIGIFDENMLSIIDYAETKGILDSSLIDVGTALSKSDKYTIRPLPAELLENAHSRMMSQGDDRISTRVNDLILLAIHTKASDMHIESHGDCVRVRFRIDGVLQTQPIDLTPEEHSAIVSRIKKMAALDIMERRLPQDGRILIRIPDPGNPDSMITMDLRISVVPFVFAEKVVIRFLDKSAFPPRLEDVGISDHHLKIFRSWLNSEYGMVVVSGPTGSGKTTTLYLMLQELAERESINVVSVEDPVEYHLPGTQQLQVNHSIGLTMTAAIQSLMRQDPDVIGIGEIRETGIARLAAQIAQSGHLVLTQMHAHSAVATIKLLFDLGVPGITLREMIIGVISQRLVRKLCSRCKERMVPEEIASLDTEEPPTQLYRSVGCSHCHNTGFQGRAIIMEMLRPQDAFWKQLESGGTVADLTAALPSDFRSLRQDGFRLALNGITSIGEINRVISV